MTQYDRYFFTSSHNPNGKFWKLGSAWIGYDAVRHKIPKAVLTLGLPKEIHNKSVFTVRRKGFGAVFYPPFSLHKDVDFQDLCLGAKSFCQTLVSFKTSVLKVHTQKGQISIELLGQDKRLTDFARECVLFFDQYREIGEPIHVSDRLKKALTQSQIDNLMRWGNPYLFDDFTFNIQLTGQIPEGMASQLSELLQKQFMEHLSSGLVIGGLSLFGQNNDHSPARLLSFFPFQKKSRESEKVNMESISI